MKIWKMNFELDEYDNLTENIRMSIGEIQSFDGRSKTLDWKPIEVKRMEPEKGLELSNSPGFHFPVFDKKALNVLLPIMENEVEFLPLICKEGEFFIINVTNVLDCINYESSKYRTFRDGKRIMAFEKYSFKEEIVKSNDIFKIIDEPRRDPFVSDNFKKVVENAGLTGFKFKLVWDSEET